MKLTSVTRELCDLTSGKARTHCICKLCILEEGEEGSLDVVKGEACSLKGRLGGKSAGLVVFRV